MYWGVGKYCSEAGIALFKSRNSGSDFCLWLCTVHGNVCWLAVRRNKQKSSERERENKPLHFQLNHIKHSVNCNTAAEAWRTGCTPSSYKSSNNILLIVTIPASQHFLTECTLGCTERLLQREREREEIIQRKCFKWQLTARGRWNGCWVFWQNSILSAPPLSPSQPPISCSSPPPLLNPSCCPLLSSNTVVMKICFLVSVFLFYLQQPPRAESRCLSPDECVCSSHVSAPTEEIKLSTERAQRLLCTHTLSKTHTQIMELLIEMTVLETGKQTRNKIKI